MAAYATGASWGFPDDIPDPWSQEDIDAQIRSEHDDDAEESNVRADTTARPMPRPEAEDDPPAAQPKQERNHYPPRTCRICFDAVLPTLHPLDEVTAALPTAFQPRPRVIYESPPGDGGRLLRPCKCKGSQKYVHEECLQAWRMQDPTQKRNYWQCPTCLYKYSLQRLSWGSWISSTFVQIGLTITILVATMFFLGFVADPIINLYIDPYETIATAGGPTGSLIFEDEPATWVEHFIKGLTSLGLLGFAKFIFTLSPFQWFSMRNTGVMGGGGGRPGGTGRERLQQISWIAVIVGISVFLLAVWKGVRAWSRRTLENARDRVMDVSGAADDDDDDD